MWMRHERPHSKSIPTPHSGLTRACFPCTYLFISPKTSCILWENTVVLVTLRMPRFHTGAYVGSTICWISLPRFDISWDMRRRLSYHENAVLFSIARYSHADQNWMVWSSAFDCIPSARIFMSSAISLMRNVLRHN